MRASFPDPGGVVEQYEAVRREALEGAATGRRGHGLTLLLSRGMAAWVAAWRELLPRCPWPSPGPEPLPSEMRSVLPPGVRSDLTTVLADMVLACGEEESAA
jgi:hypothetical protein